MRQVMKQKTNNYELKDRAKDEGLISDGKIVLLEQINSNASNTATELI